jgi:DNA-binding transcriptional ArsR family regulator
MPDRAFISRELASLLGVLAHSERIRIVQELRSGELDVNSLQSLLGVAHSRVSQNLSILRSHRIVAERREGRHVFYHLVQPRIAAWLLDGLEFLEREAVVADEIRTALGSARATWSGSKQTAVAPDKDLVPKPTE